jgi:hypothetical protein
VSDDTAPIGQQLSTLWINNLINNQQSNLLSKMKTICGVPEFIIHNYPGIILSTLKSIIISSSFYLTSNSDQNGEYFDEVSGYFSDIETKPDDTNSEPLILFTSLSTVKRLSKVFRNSIDFYFFWSSFGVEEPFVPLATTIIHHIFYVTLPSCNKKVMKNKDILESLNSFIPDALEAVAILLPSFFGQFVSQTNNITNKSQQSSHLNPKEWISKLTQLQSWKSLNIMNPLQFSIRLKSLFIFLFEQLSIFNINIDSTMKRDIRNWFSHSKTLFSEPDRSEIIQLISNITSKPLSLSDTQPKDLFSERIQKCEPSQTDVSSKLSSVSTQKISKSIRTERYLQDPIINEPSPLPNLKRSANIFSSSKTSNSREIEKTKLEDVDLFKESRHISKEKSHRSITKPNNSSHLFHQSIFKPSPLISVNQPIDWNVGEIESVSQNKVITDKMLPRRPFKMMKAEKTENCEEKESKMQMELKFNAQNKSENRNIDIIEISSDENSNVESDDDSDDDEYRLIVDGIDTLQHEIGSENELIEADQNEDSDDVNESSEDAYPQSAINEEEIQKMIEKASQDFDDEIVSIKSPQRQPVSLSFSKSKSNQVNPTPAQSTEKTETHCIIHRATPLASSQPPRVINLSQSPFPITTNPTTTHYNEVTLELPTKSSKWRSMIDIAHSYPKRILPPTPPLDRQKKTYGNIKLINDSPNRICTTVSQKVVLFILLFFTFFFPLFSFFFFFFFSFLSLIIFCD